MAWTPTRSALGPAVIWEGEGLALPDHRAASDVVGAAWSVEARVVILPTSALPADFFRLQSGLLGELTQKMSNYGLRLVVLGALPEEALRSASFSAYVVESHRSETVRFLSEPGPLALRDPSALALGDVARIVLVPRWSGDASSDYLPWLIPQLSGLATVSRLLPTPGAPEVEPTVAALTELLGDDPALLSRTLVLAHSVGCQAAMRGIARLGPGRVVRGLLAVAGWWSVDQPWPSILPWMADFDHAATAAHLGAAIALISDNDPFTADWRANKRLFEQRIGAVVRVVPGAAHFNVPALPRALDELSLLATGPCAG